MLCFTYSEKKCVCWVHTKSEHLHCCPSATRRCLYSPFVVCIGDWCVLISPEYTSGMKLPSTKLNKHTISEIRTNTKRNICRNTQRINAHRYTNGKTPMWKVQPAIPKLQATKIGTAVFALVDAFGYTSQRSFELACCQVHNFATPLFANILSFLRERRVD